MTNKNVESLINAAEMKLLRNIGQTMFDKIRKKSIGKELEIPSR